MQAGHKFAGFISGEAYATKTDPFFFHVDLLLFEWDSYQDFGWKDAGISGGGLRKYSQHFSDLRIRKIM